MTPSTSLTQRPLAFNLILMQAHLSFLTVLTAVMLQSTTLLAQQCTNIEFFALNISENAPDVFNANYLISNANGMPTADGMWQVTPFGASTGICLSVGCYTLTVWGDWVNDDNLEVQLAQSDFIEILDLDLNEESGGWVAEFCVEAGEQFDCPDEIDYADGEGCNWAFEIGSFVEGEQVLWNFGDGTDPIWGGHFIEHTFAQSGEFTVSAWYTSWDCPMGVELWTDIVVEGCGGDLPCDVEMVVTTEDGMWYTFSIPEAYANANIQWFIDEQAVEGANGLVFEMGFDFNPFWTVCVEVVTDACPEGAEACYSNLQTGCPEGISVDSNGCFFVFSLGNLDNQEIGWSVDGTFIEWSNYAFDWTFETGGWHVIQAVYYSANCPGETYVIEVNTEGCGGGEECPLNLVWNEIECNQYFIEALNQPEGATLFWTLDGEPYEYGAAEMIFTFAEDGCHVFGVGYETPNCPQGAFAEVELCSDCTGMECGVTLNYEELAEGIYLFTALTSTGEPFDGPINWWTGGQNVGSGNPFAWTWDLDEPGNVAMCYGYGSWQDCPGGEGCVEFETPGMACEEIELVVNGTWTAGIEWAIELGFEAFIDGFAIGGWSFEEAWSGSGAIDDTLTLCVPPACFEAFWGWDAANVDVESLVVAVMLSGQDPLTLFDWFEPATGGDFGLLPDCIGSVGVVESLELTPLAWPNPVRDILQWNVPESWNNGTIQVTALDGRTLVNQQVAGHRGSLDVSSWPVGWYLLTWQHGTMAPAVFKFAVAR